MVRGLAEEAGKRIADARRARAFADVNDLATRARLAGVVAISAG